MKGWESQTNGSKFRCLSVCVCVLACVCMHVRLGARVHLWCGVCTHITIKASD